MKDTFQEVAELLYDTKVDMSVSRNTRTEIEIALAVILRRHFTVKSANNDSRGQGLEDWKISEKDWEGLES